MCRLLLVGGAFAGLWANGGAWMTQHSKPSIIRYPGAETADNVIVQTSVFVRSKNAVDQIYYDLQRYM